MNKTLIFILGGITGSLLTWKIVKDKYKKIADEEIKSVVDVFTRRRKELEEKYKVLEQTEQSEHTDFSNNEDDEYNYEGAKEYDEDEDIEVIDMYHKKVVEAGYSDEIIDLNSTKKPYIIAPEDFGEEVGYEEVSLLYCTDKILLDEDDMMFNNYEEIIGDALKEFDDIRVEAVYVRNENEKIDYEILRSEKRSDEINPRLNEI